MTGSSGKPKARYVRELFNRIAGHYDRMNRWMTWGQDVRWRREAINLTQLPQNGRMLDIGTGTGDIALLAAEKDETSVMVGADLTLAMIRVAQRRAQVGLVRWVVTDALDLPFGGNSFDAVVSGFLLRNVVDIDQALAEQYRVLKPGGRMVCLETTPTSSGLRHLPVRIYLKHVIPLLGKLIASDGEAYTYLPETTQEFLDVEQLKERVLKAGFGEIGYHKYMWGTIAIHWGTK